MSDIDILEVPFEDFWNRRECHAPLDPKVELKIKNLLTAYDCFSKDLLFYAPPSTAPGTKNGKPRNFNRGVRYMHHSAASDNPILKKPRTPLKEVQGLLNKITKSSFADLVQKIIRCCAYKECSQEVIQEILKKCYIHGSYSDLYHGLLLEMYKRYQDDTALAIKHFVSQFLEHLPDELTTLEFQPNPNHDYEGFCLYVKCKKNMHNKLQNIIVIIKHYGELVDVDDIYTQLFSIVIKQLEKVIRYNEKTYHDYVDLLSSLIAVLHKEKVIQPKETDDLIFVYNDIRIAFPELPKKIHFCWEEILHN